MFDARLRAIDASGNPLVGASLTIYTAGTTTPVSIFRNAALSTPMTNPTTGSDVSDAGGWFPQVYAAEGLLVDILLKNSSGTTVQSYTSVSFLGADTGEFSRTMADGTRVKFRGSAGVVYLEFGDPSPDNIGGTAIIGGWAGTQADLITVNAALFNTTGPIKENSKKLIGTVYTEATTFTGVANIDIPLTASPTGVLAWDIDIWDYTQNTDLKNIYGRLSYDGGATYRSGASDYYGQYSYTSAGSQTISNDITAAQMEFGTNFRGSAAIPGVGRIRIITPASGTAPTRVTTRFDGISSAPSLQTALGNWYGVGSYGNATHLRILPAGGLITGKYRVTPLRGFGEA